MNTRIDLYSATGAIMPGKPYKPAKVLKLIAKRRAQWITEGVSAQLLYWTDAELEADRQRIYKRECENRSDEVVHLGEWAVVQSVPGIDSPAGWQLKHPRLSEPPRLTPVTEVA